MTSPVRKLDSGEARKDTTWLTSAGRPNLPSGVSAINALSIMGVIRFRGDASSGHDSNALITRELGAIGELPGVMGVHWCETDVEASTIEVEERKNRSIEIPASFVLIEAVDENAANNALRTLVDNGRLQSRGVTELCNDGIYILESDIFPAATASGA